VTKPTGTHQKTPDWGCLGEQREKGLADWRWVVRRGRKEMREGDERSEEENPGLFRISDGVAGYRETGMDVAASISASS
jgi:hypothetical protein